MKDDKRDKLQNQLGDSRPGEPILHDDIMVIPLYTSKYAPEVRAAVMAALLSGQSIGSLAKEYKIPSSQISQWKRQLRKHLDKPDISNLIYEYLEAAMQALIVQTQAFSDPGWLQQQEASQLAVLHGVLADKIFRILEAMERANAYSAHAEGDRE